jgi:winged helix DNA-binding protein
MTRSLSDDQVRRLRMRSQRLTGRRPRDVHELVRAVGGLQAQDTRASRLAARPRGSGLDVAAVALACNQERSVVRTWAMRGTLHMVAAQDAGWLVRLLGPVFAAGNRRRRLQLGLDQDVCERALQALPEVLGGGPLPRAELVAGLAAMGIGIDPRGQAPAHLVAYAAMRGLVCRGPDLAGDEPSYVLLDDWVGGGRPGNSGWDPERAMAELTRRYLAGHGPAGPEDFAAWSGLPVGPARRGFQLVAGELVEVEAGGRRMWLPARAPVVPPGATRRPVVRLLPRFDDYLLGWRGRELVLHSRFARRIQAGGGWIHAAVVVDGRVVGTWRSRRSPTSRRPGPEAPGLRDRLAVLVEPFERLDPEALGGLEAEAADVGRFLGAEATLTVAG